MKKFILSACIVLCGIVGLAQEAAQRPEMPKPSKEHEWLKQGAGEWEWTSDMNMPGVPPMKGKGTESVKMIGDFWRVAESEGTCEGMPGKMTSVFTLGYSPAKKKFVGTWVDSVMPHLWVYEGELDEATNTLTLSTEGFCAIRQKIAPFKEVVKVIDADHREFTSNIQNDDGSWTTFMTLKATRKK